MKLRIGIITTSDRSFTGNREDLTTSAVADEISAVNWIVIKHIVIPDDLEVIKKTLLNWLQLADLDVIFTTGGTGFTPRDNTPEATLAVIERNAPGLAEGMRLRSLEFTPHAMLSRGVAGIHGKVLIINLPGSPKAAVENFKIIQPILEHAVELIHNDENAEDHH
ncbi:MAG TPA: MogA/MoaB family molybdenum cofactor biosynthesis protein [Anaerolineales bacterium]|nr:MogA/MoaB family molybdenum cofactor biosynthesis protein [Anaerolineales bacterium]